MSKDIKNKNKDLDEFEIDFEEDSKKEELDEFDFDDDSESNEVEDDFDFDSEESSQKEEVKDDFDFDDDSEDSSEKEEVEDDFDFDDDSEESSEKEEVEDDFDFDDDSEDSSEKEEVEDDFDFDSEESSEKEEVKDDFDFDDDSEESSEKEEVKDDFDFDDDSKESSEKEEVEEDFDFGNNEDETFDFDDNEDDEIKASKEKEEKENQKKLEEDFEDEEEDLDIEDIFSSSDEDEDENKDDLDYVNDFINKEDEEEDFEKIEDDIDSRAMKVTQNLDIQDEEDIVKEEVKVEDLLQNKKSNSFSFKKFFAVIFSLGVLGVSGFAGYVYKDNILSIISNDNSLEREGDSIYSEEFEKRTTKIAEKIVSDKILNLNKTISDYENKIAEIEINQVSLMNKNKALEVNTKDQKSIINTIQKNNNKDNKSMLKLQEQLEQFIVEIDSVKEEQLNNKDLLKKTVEATLNLIKENKMLDKDLEEKIYNKVYTEFKKVFDSQRFRLNDLSIIEGKLNEALSFNKKILQDLKQAKINNQKLMEEQRDFNRKIIKLEKAIENQDKQISSSNVDNQNNVINLLKKNDKEPKNAIIIDKKASNTNGFTIPKYHLQGIIGGNVAYIKVKGQEESRARPYSVGDTLDGYGKILKIETSYIVTEKGELRRNRK